MGASERVIADQYDKDNVADFVLWKAIDVERDGDIFWESPFGRGRPGWHIECSAMATKLLGETIDIHVGGIDNMFPHHENEIAQSEACTGKTFANIWMHSQHLIVDNKKMSNSAGNFFTLRDLLAKGYTGIEVRYMLLQTHYKTQLNFTFAGLEAVRGSLQRLQDFIFRLQHITSAGSPGLVEPVVSQAYIAFATSLADDLNISSALAALFELVREVNGLSDAGNVSKDDAELVLQLLKKFNEVLGVLSFEKAPEEFLRTCKMPSQGASRRGMQRIGRLPINCAIKLPARGTSSKILPRAHASKRGVNEPVSTHKGRKLYDRSLRDG